jgi:hypothetical protein
MTPTGEEKGKNGYKRRRGEGVGIATAAPITVATVS